jgi:hypothetical protein
VPQDNFLHNRRKEKFPTVQEKSKHLYISVKMRLDGKFPENGEKRIGG